MSIAATVNQAIDKIPPGRVFGYEVLPQYLNTSDAVIRAVGRRVEKRQLQRIAKGLFYRPKEGILGEVPVSDGERLRSLLFKSGRRVGYITGSALSANMTETPETFGITVGRWR